jgi:hypothetical protein
MPTQKRLRRHEQSVALPPREHPGKRRQQGTIRRSQREAPLLPSEHDQLMAQHEQLEVLSEFAAPASDD